MHHLVEGRGACSILPVLQPAHGRRRQALRNQIRLLSAMSVLPSSVGHNLYTPQKRLYHVCQKFQVRIQ